MLAIQMYQWHPYEFRAFVCGIIMGAIYTYNIIRIRR